MARAILIVTASLVALTAPLLAASQQAPEGGVLAGQGGTIIGRVVDGSGGVLPGVTVTVSGSGTDRKVVTDRYGEYRVEGLPPGTYRLEATLAGFRPAVVESVAVSGKTSTVDIRMRLGILALSHFVLPSDGVPGALREAAVVAQLQITESLGTRLRNNDSSIAVEHRARIVAVVKADRPEIAADREILFDQPDAGEWFENGARTAVGIEAPYDKGSSFIAFLRRNPDGTLSEAFGPSYMFPAAKGFVIVPHPTGTLPPGLRSPMPVDECLSALRKVLAGGGQFPN